jgi:hypothetical protein
MLLGVWSHNGLAGSDESFGGWRFQHVHEFTHRTVAAWQDDFSIEMFWRHMQTVAMVQSSLPRRPVCGTVCAVDCSSGKVLQRRVRNSL